MRWLGGGLLVLLFSACAGGDMKAPPVDAAGGSPDAPIDAVAERPGGGDAGSDVVACGPGTFSDGKRCTPCTPVAGCAGAVTCTSADNETCERCAAGLRRLEGGK